MDSKQKTFLAAKKAREHAYAPYSNYAVGVAIKIAGQEEPFVGCNVENASYGATVCAERNAIFSSIASLGKPKFEHLVVVIDAEKVVAPCALCLQVIAEFCEPDFPVHLANLEGIQETKTFAELLPRPFNRKELLK